MVSEIGQKYLTTKSGLKIAYRKVNALASQEGMPEVVFCGGYASDMKGSKAEYLAEVCENQGLGFLRFDYRGHGESEGRFEDFGIGDWIEDAESAIFSLTKHKIILIGSSMGGWIATYLAQKHSKKVESLIGIAAAPDFTEDMFWNSFTTEEKAKIDRGEIVERPSGYDEPYRISPALIRQGRDYLILRSELNLPMPVRLFQGLEDASVSSETALRLANHAQCSDLTLEFVKNADHSFSRPTDLIKLKETINSMLYAQKGDAPN